VTTESRFDLLTYARRHRYRLRNIHDGKPVPPARIQQAGRGRQASRSDEDRCIVIACKDGYICDECDGLSWVLLCETKRSFNFRLRQLECIDGLMVKQEGDSEAAGAAPYDGIEAVIKVLEPYRRQPPRPGTSAEQMRKIRPKSTKPGSGPPSGA